MKLALLGSGKIVQELLPRVGRVKIVECNYSQYSSRYDAFRAGQITPAVDRADRWLEHSLAVMRVLDRAQRTMGA